MDSVFSFAYQTTKTPARTVEKNTVDRIAHQPGTAPLLILFERRQRPDQFRRLGRAGENPGRQALQVGQAAQRLAHLHQAAFAELHEAADGGVAAADLGAVDQGMR